MRFLALLPAYYHFYSLSFFRREDLRRRVAVGASNCARSTKCAYIARARTSPSHKILFNKHLCKPTFLLQLMYRPLMPGIARFVWDSCWAVVPLGLLAASLACFGYIAFFIWLVGSARPLASIIPSSKWHNPCFGAANEVVFVPSYFASSSLCFTSLSLMSIYPVNRSVAKIPGNNRMSLYVHMRACVYVHACA